MAAGGAETAAQDAAARATSSARPAVPPFEVIALNRPAAAARSVLKVVVFNAGGGANVGGITSCLSHPPLSDAGTILLCEATWLMPRHRRVKLASELAAALGMSFAFIPSFGRYGHDGQIRAAGNAILCAQPLEEIRVTLLPNHSPRTLGYRMPGVPAALTASVETGGGPLTVAVAHLERRWDPAGRALQMEKFLATIGHAHPAVIGGDLNTTTMGMDSRWALARAAAAMALSPRRFHTPQQYEPLFEHLETHGFTVEGANVPHAPTFTPSGLIPPLWRPKLDWLAARGIAPVMNSAVVVSARASRFGRRVSDHDFVVCEFRL